MKGDKWGKENKVKGREKKARVGKREGKEGEGRMG